MHPGTENGSFFYIWRPVDSVFVKALLISACQDTITFLEKGMESFSEYSELF